MYRQQDGYLPRAVWIQTQNRCNFSCNICPYARFSAKKPKGEMDERLFNRIISQLRSFNSIEKISFNMQNEPLLDRDIARKIKYVKDLSGLHVMVTTNGYYLSKGLIGDLICSGIDKITVSLNACSKERYRLITNSDSYEFIVENIKRLIESKPDYLEVVISFVVTESNSGEVHDFVNIWKGSGAMLRIYKANNKAGLLYHGKEIIPQKRDCRAPFEEINICYGGEMVLCRQDWSNRVVFGNLNNEALSDIWFSDKFISFRKKFRESPDKLLPCRFCNREGWKGDYIRL